ncbi:response regulator [Isoalcanivorax indicus]|uniref:response regulator n=1 Tax=Isoalcanivorax indicus TaxID=2202653 RepID=UPI000DB98CB2|nr:response regulator [Isoalcanivorax indicus]
MTAYNIMIVDDEENILKSLSRCLRHKENWSLETFTNADDALRRARTRIFDAVITDYNMPDIDGMSFLAELRALQPDAVRIVLTGVVNIDTLMAAINEAGAFRFIPKPWDDTMLIDSIEEGLRLRDTLLENRMLARQVRDLQDEVAQLRARLGK